MKKVIALILAVTLALLMIPSVANAASGIQVVDRTGDGQWTDDTWKVEIYPGETKSTTVSLYNSSSSSLEVVATILPESLDGGNLNFELDKSTFTMPGRSYSDITLTVKASGSTTPGTYTAELRIKSEVAPSEDEDDGVSRLRLYGLTVNNITQDSADIVWKTSRTSTSQVTYWSSPGVTLKDKTYVRKHLVHLENLEQDTTYYFEVVSRDKYRRKASDEGEFTTLKKIPKPKPTPTPSPTPTPTPTPAPTPPPTPTPAPTPPLAPPTAEKPTPWGLIGGVVGGLAAAGGIGYWFWRRLTGGDKVGRQD